jgi:hypothetical protein
LAKRHRKQNRPTQKHPKPLLAETGKKKAENPLINKAYRVHGANPAAITPPVN